MTFICVPEIYNTITRGNSPEAADRNWDLSLQLGSYFIIHIFNGCDHTVMSVFSYKLAFELDELFHQANTLHTVYLD